MQPSTTSTTTPSFNRAERLINRLVGDKIMTPAGKDWLIAMIDPFHDTELKNLSGWPDVETGYSVVRKVKQQVSLAAPNAAPFTGNNWDCLIGMFPTLHATYYNSTTSRLGNTYAAENVNGAPLGGISAWAIQPGTNWLPLAGTTSTVWLNSINALPPFTTGLGRCVGIGFEVNNTTSTLYRQGSVTVFKQMSTQRDANTFWGEVANPGGPLQAIFSGTIIRSIPNNLADLTLLPGSRTWKAEDGCYVVGHFHSNENPPFVADYNVPIFTLDDDEEITQGSSALQIPVMAVGAITGSVAPNAAHLHPLHTSGAYFAGLSNQTTLQLTVIYYYETFPTQSENDILVMATPSAEFDPVALEIYSHALSCMPPGCMVMDNPFGEWFADVVDQVSNALSYIPHPLAQALSAAGKVGTGMYRGTVSTSIPAKTTPKPLPPIPKKKVTPARTGPKPLPPLPIKGRVPKKK